MTIKFNGVRVVNASGGAGGGGVSWPGDGTKLLAGDGTQVVVGDNLTLSAGELSAANGSAGWTTALDLDFSTLSNQTISTDGTHTVGGKTWTKQNSAREAAAMAVVNGQGLIIQPSQSTDFYNGDRSSPLLYLPLSQLGIPNLTWSTRLRLSVYFSADNLQVTNYHRMFIALEQLGTPTSSNPYTFSVERGVYPPGATSIFFRETSSGGVPIGTNVQSMDSSNRTLVLELCNGMAGGRIIAGHTSTIGNEVIPDLFHTTTSSSPKTSISNCGLSIGAMRAGSGATLSVTVARVLVEYCY